MNTIREANMESGVLFISLQGSIDSVNTAEVEEALFALISEHNAHSVVIDAENLLYISSAGLRVILKVKKAVNQFRIVSVSSDLYEIFDMTGFTSIMDIEKGLRRISLEGCEQLGKGGHGRIYRLDKETIVKVYVDDSSLERITDEMNRAKNAFICGVPTAISYDVVDCGEGRLGVVYEMMQGTLSEYLNAHPEQFDEYARKYAELLRTLHTVDADAAFFGSFKELYIARAQALRADIGDEKVGKLIEFINAIPDAKTLLHGDCHPNNIMVQNGELLLIDMADVAVGNPIFEWTAIHQDLVSIGEERCKPIIGIEYADAQRLFDKVLRAYLRTDDEQKIQGIVSLCQPIMLLRMLLTTATGTKNAAQIKAMILGYANQALFPNIDKFIQMAQYIPTSLI